MSWEELSKLTKEEIIECAKELKNCWQKEVWDKNEILNDRFELQRKINKAIEEIECEIERYDGSNEDFISASWVEMKTDDYITKLKNILEILGDKE